MIRHPGELFGLAAGFGSDASGLRYLLILVIVVWAALVDGVEPSSAPCYTWQPRSASGSPGWAAPMGC